MRAEGKEIWWKRAVLVTVWRRCENILTKERKEGGMEEGKM